MMCRTSRVVGSAAAAAAHLALLIPVFAWAEAAAVDPLVERLRHVAELRLDGDAAQADRELKVAIDENPNFAPARWQAGSVFFQGAWIDLTELNARMPETANLAEYRAYRNAILATEFPKQYSSGTGPRYAGGVSTISIGRTVSYEAAPSPAAAYAHFKLSVWCRQHNLLDEERTHLQLAVQNDSNYLDEAAKRLNLVAFNGRLMKTDEITAARAEELEQQTANREWTAKLSTWRKAARSKTAKIRDAALAQIAEVDDPSIIPAAEAFTLPEQRTLDFRSDAPAFDRAIVELLGRLPAVVATESLVKHALLAPDADLRRLAAQLLRERDLQETVPQLLSCLGWPVKFVQQSQITPGTEWSYERKADGGERSQSQTTLLRAGRWEKQGNRVTRIPNLWKETTNTTQWGRVDFMYNYQPPKASYVGTMVSESPNQVTEQHVIARVQLGQGQMSPAQYNAMNREMEISVAAYNESLPEQNQRVSAALSTALATRLEPGLRSGMPNESSDPDEWHKWWYDYNELDRPERKPYVVVDYCVSGFNALANMFTARGGYYWERRSTTELLMALSCFPKGTLISTSTGPVPVEEVKIGDRVLAQDCQTGELAYKPVLGTTLRPPADVLAIQVGSATLRSTKGHPFFVAGKGWRMAKEIQVGDRLVSLGKLLPVESIESESERVSAHNLIVADASTYFVGEARILVHDNSPIGPSRVLLPGYARADH